MGFQQLIAPRSDEQLGPTWALNRKTRCGITGFVRPCQSCSPGHIDNYPFADVCAAQDEVIFIVADKAQEREALAEVIAAAGYAVECAQDALQLQELMATRSPACMVLDIELRGPSGIEVQEWAVANGVIAPIILLWGLDDRHAIIQAMKNGATDLLVKPVGELKLRKAITAAIGIFRQRNCVAQSRKLIIEKLGLLTETERKIATLLSNGLSTRMIASELGRSETVINLHKRRLMSKLEVVSVATIANLLGYLSATSDCQIRAPSAK